MKKMFLALSVIALTMMGCNSGSTTKESEKDIPDLPHEQPKVPDYQAGRAAPMHKEKIVFDNVNLITMSSENVEQVLNDQRIVIVKNKIVEFGDAQTISLEGAEVIDGNDGYLLPGFIDSHTHTAFNGIDAGEAVIFTDPAQMSMYLQQGITTIRSYSGVPRNLLWREKVNSGEWLGTRIISSGPIIRDRQTEQEKLGINIDELTDEFLTKIPLAFPRSAAEGKAAVSEQKNLDYDFIKVYSAIAEPLYLAVSEQAKEDDIFIAGHIPQAPLETVLKNHNEIAHLLMLIESYEEFKEELSWDDYQTWVITTMLENNVSLVFNWSTDEVVMEIGQGVDVYNREKYQVLPAKILNGWRAQAELGSDITPEMQQLALSLVKDIIDANVVVQAGSDTADIGSIPEFVLRDLELMVEGGVTPYQALLTATDNPAKVISHITKKPQNRGIIQTDFYADLVLLKNNPLEDISNIRARHGVMVDGHWLNHEQLTLMVEQFSAMPLESLAIEFKD
jgi:imidazolonepropionase-like amidohydrolase